MRTLSVALLALLCSVPYALAQEAPAPPEKELKPSERKIEMTKYYMVFLRRGPSWTAEKTPETAALGKGHMDNIKRLADEGSLVLAGPFLEQSGAGALAGLFLFKVESAEQAKALTESDPAVKAGRFVYEIVPWFGPKSLTY